MITDKLLGKGELLHGKGKLLLGKGDLRTLALVDFVGQPLILLFI